MPRRTHFLRLRFYEEGNVDDQRLCGANDHSSDVARLRVRVHVNVHLEPVLAPVVRDAQPLVANKGRLRAQRLA